MKKTVIEETAIELAAEVYDTWRRNGMPCEPYRNQRHYVRKNFEKFIPKAIDLLLEILHNSGTSELMKEQIYDAFLSRNQAKITIAGHDVSSHFKEPLNGKQTLQ